MRADTLISGHTLFYKVSAEAPHRNLSPSSRVGYLGGHCASGHFPTCVRPLAFTLPFMAVNLLTPKQLTCSGHNVRTLYISRGGGHAAPSLEGACPSGCPPESPPTIWAAMVLSPPAERTAPAREAA
jgi:hypothetical protein